MTFKPWVAAAALTVFSIAAQAASSFGALGPGEYALDLALSDPSGFLLADGVSFTLNQGSQVTGTLSGAMLNSVSYRDFTESGGAKTISVVPVNAGGTASFDLGTLRGGFGFDPTSYKLQLTGLVNTPGTTSLRMTLTVSAIPEASTWAMFAMGLAGVVGVTRVRPKAKA